jgi:hypothetical protein
MARSTLARARSLKSGRRRQRDEKTRRSKEKLIYTRNERLL